MNDRVFITGARRSPFGRYLGGLSGKNPLELAAEIGDAALRQAQLPPEAIDQVYVGNCFAASFDTASVVGRQLALGLGISGFATTVDTACCSPLTALRLAVLEMAAGRTETALIVGVESMSRVPHLARGLRQGVRAGPVTLADPIFPIEYKGYAPVAQDAQFGAEKYGISRAEMDGWALRSHQRWADAMEAGRFDDEIVPLTVRGRKGSLTVARDEQPRPDTTLEKLASLKPIFGTDCITAGNAPGLNDGAAAMVLVSGRKGTPAAALGSILACAGTSDAPNGIGWVPAKAIRCALAGTDHRLEDLALLEINEAFAAMPLVSTRALADGDEELWARLKQQTNVNGGAVAIGHPVGASGLRILATLVYELRRRGGGLGAAAICGGLSQGEGVLVGVE